MTFCDTDLPAPFLRVYARPHRLAAAFMAALHRDAVVFDPQSTDLAGFFSTVLSQLDLDAGLADPSSLDLARRLLSIPPGADLMPGRPLGLRMNLVLSLHKALYTLPPDQRRAMEQQADYPPFDLAVTLARSLSRMVAQGGAYLPEQTLDLVNRALLARGPGRPLPGIDRYRAILFDGCLAFSAMEARVLHLLAAAHPAVAFVFLFDSDPFAPLPPHLSVTATQVETVIAGDLPNVETVFRERREVTALGSLVAAGPGLKPGLSDQPGVLLHRNRPEVSLYHCPGRRRQAELAVSQLKDAPGDCPPVLASGNGVPDLDLVCRLHKAGIAVSGTVTATMGRCTVFRLATLPLTLLASSRPTPVMRAMLLALAPGHAQSPGLRRQASALAAVLASDLDTLARTCREARESSDTDAHARDIARRHGLNEVLTAALVKTLEVLALAGQGMGPDLARGLLRYWQEVGRRFLDDLSQRSLPGHPAVESLEVACLLALGRLLAGLEREGDLLNLAEVRVKVDAWAATPLSRSCDGGPQAVALVSGLDADDRPAGLTVLVDGDADHWPGSLTGASPLGFAMDRPFPMGDSPPGGCALEALAARVQASDQVAIICPRTLGPETPRAVPWQELHLAAASLGMNLETTALPGVVFSPRPDGPPDALDCATVTNRLRSDGLNLLEQRVWPRDILPELPQPSGSGVLSGAALDLSRATVSHRMASLSATFLDQAYNCPFVVMVRHLWGVSEPDQDTLGLSPKDEGDLVHQVLARVYASMLALNKGNPVTPGQGVASLEKMRDEARNALDALVDEARAQGMAVSKTMVARVASLVFATLDKDISRLGAAGDAVSAVELKLFCPLPGGDGRLTGTIDRVEKTADNRSLRVVDYKVGGSDDFKYRLATPGMDENGRFQMPLYLYLARQSLDPEGRTAMTPMLYSLRENEGISSSDSDPAQAAYLPGKEVPGWQDALLDSVAAVRERTLDGVFAPWPRAGACEHCQFSALCRRESP